MYEDVVHFAAQTGRLDFLTSVLAVLAILLGLGAFPVYHFVQRKAEKIAKEAADKVLKDTALKIEQEAISRIEAMLPTLVREYQELAKNAAGAEMADAIARAQEEGGNDKND